MSASSKWKLEMAPYLNGKESSAHLSTVKIDGDSTQHMRMLCGQVSILLFFATSGLALIPDFYSGDELFSRHKELVPRLTHHSFLQCNRHFECINKLLANRLVNGASDKDIVGELSVQPKKEI